MLLFMSILLFVVSSKNLATVEKTGRLTKGFILVHITNSVLVRTEVIVHVVTFIF